MTKRPVIADLAAELAEKGSEVARTGAAGQLADATDAQDADLFAEFDRELENYAGSAIRPPQRRGPGRPKGSSRDTIALKRLMAARGYRDPLEFLGALVSSETGQLADDIGIPDRGKVLDLQVKAAVQLAQYLHNRAPLQVHHQGDIARTLVVIGNGQIGGKAAGDSLAMSAIDYEDFQTLNAPAADTSHGKKSHE